MPKRGRIPKRVEDLVRPSNRNPNPPEKVEVYGKCEIPELNIPDAHPLAVDFYESLKISAQSRFFEPSDWQVARFACAVMTKLMSRHATLNGAVLATLNHMFQGLLATEESRRKMHMEINRGDKPQETSIEELADAFKAWASE